MDRWAWVWLLTVVLYFGFVFWIGRDLVGFEVRRTWCNGTVVYGESGWRCLSGVRVE